MRIIKGVLLIIMPVIATLFIYYNINKWGIGIRLIIGLIGFPSLIWLICIGLEMIFKKK